MEDRVPALSLGSEQQSSHCGVQQPLVDGVHVVALLERDKQQPHKPRSKTAVDFPAAGASTRRRNKLFVVLGLYNIYFVLPKKKTFWTVRSVTAVNFEAQQKLKGFNYSCCGKRPWSYLSTDKQRRISLSDKYAAIAHFYAVWKRSSVLLCTPTGKNLTFSPVGWITLILLSLCRARNVFILLHDKLK